MDYHSLVAMQMLKVNQPSYPWPDQAAPGEEQRRGGLWRDALAVWRLMRDLARHPGQAGGNRVPAE